MASDQGHANSAKHIMAFIKWQEQLFRVSISAGITDITTNNQIK